VELPQTFLVVVCFLPQLQPPFKMISRAGHFVVRQARTQLRPRTGPTPLASLSALARLLSSLAVLEQRDGKLNHGSLGAVTAAKKLGGSITGFVAGGNIKAVAEEAAKVNGIEKIIAVDNAAYDKASSCLQRCFGCFLTIGPGSARKLCSFVSREYQERRIHTHYCWPHCVWEELDAPRCRITRCSADIRHYSY